MEQDRGAVVPQRRRPHRAQRARAPILENMDALPFVTPVYKRDLKIENYFIGYLKHPYISLYTGRGCKSRCTFCLWPQTVGGHRYRTRSVEHVIEEIAWAKKAFPAGEGILLRRRHVHRQPAARRGDRQGTGQARRHLVVQRQGQRAARDAQGAARQRPAPAAGRLRDRATSRSCTTSRRACGSRSRGASPRTATSSASPSTAPSSSGLPGETQETIEETIRFATEINPHTIQVSLAAPYPGTFLYRQALENGWLDGANAELVDDARHPDRAAALSASRATPRSSTRSRPSTALLFPPRQDRLDRRRDGAKPRDDEAAAARGRRVLSLPARAARDRALKALIVTADDFGLAREVNEAVELAHADGILTAASLMVSGPAVDDAVTRARRLPSLRVGLHLVLVDGTAAAAGRERAGPGRCRRVFPRATWRGRASIFSSAPVCAGSSRRKSRRSSRRIDATGLPLDHVNCHHHFHVHPTIAGQILEIGSRYGMRAVRVPVEPAGMYWIASRALARTVALA